MKRIPPYIGYAVLEKEDVEKMSTEDMAKLLFIYGAILGASITMVIWGLWEVLL